MKHKIYFNDELVGESNLKFLNREDGIMSGRFKTNENYEHFKNILCNELKCRVDCCLVEKFSLEENDGKFRISLVLI